MTDENLGTDPEAATDEDSPPEGGWFAYAPLSGSVVYNGSEGRRYADYLTTQEPLSLKRLLVANRGEIACRVFETASRLGIETVAVFSEPDATALHTRTADMAVALGGTTSSESYLDAHKILDAARRASADAIHPGYGFLSENPDFAQAVIDAGLTWVGPTPESIRKMALKVEAKRIAAAAGVPLVPGAELDESVTDAELIEIAESVGYPVLVKASAGGGGKGMRIVDDPDALLAAVETARREALNSFADSTVFFERYLTGARHVEVQVFGDQAGNVVHMYDRECSVQRRHQKIIEESPSPGATADTRAAMFRAATSLAREIGYVGAGTVEFLVFGEGDAQEFSFLEMNTRLQVEHPVTEAVTGLDLIEWQLRVADGQELPESQDEIQQFGHAIEVRLYAEDPANDYLPSTGVVEISELYSRSSAAARTDVSVAAGDVVTPFYDPMIGKIIVSGSSRQEAARDLARWLRTFRFAGVTTNRNSLIAILESRPFLAGETTTDFLERFPELLTQSIVDEATLDQLACVGALAVTVLSPGTAWSGLAYPGFRNVRACPQRIDFGFDGGDDLAVVYEFTAAHAGRIEVRRGGPEVSWTGPVAGSSFRAEVAADECLEYEAVGKLAIERQIVVELDGLRRQFTFDRNGDHIVVSDRTNAVTFRVLPRFADTSASAVEGALESPVPGTVVAVEVAAGDQVAEGQTLVVMEAMKMEHRIVAQAAGVISEIRVNVGQSVDAHEVLVVVE